MCVPVQTPLETLTIRAFGEVTISLQSGPVDIASAINPNEQRLQLETRATDALLIYLACHGRPLGRDVLAELFWPDRTQKQARANLRVALHRLRQKLALYLVVTHHNVGINPETPFVLDAAHFETHLSAGRLSAALALYRGDFLDGFYLDDSSAFEQWALLERERLRTLAIAAYQQLIGQSAAAGQLDSAIASAQRLLQLDPLHEPAHRQLMRLLAQTGQRSAALAQYEMCCHLLGSELSVSPDETTTNLAEQIRRGELDKVTRWQSDKVTSAADHALPLSPPHLVTLSPLHNLPSQPTPFIGRGAELNVIANLLANPDCRLLTLLGVGGIGKTRLSIEAAARQAASFATEVCFVALAPVATVELVAVTIAQTIGLRTNSSDLLAELADALRRRRLLLVLDNFEHLLAAVDTVAYLLQAASTLKVLVTSRERLYLREEWLLLINGLPLSDGLTSEAGELFLHSAQRIQPSFRGDGQAQAIATIAQSYEAGRWLAQLLPHRQILDPELRLAFLIVVHAHAVGLAESPPVARYRAELMTLVESSQHPLLQVAGWVWLARYTADNAQFVYAYEQAVALAQRADESSVPDKEFGLLADHDFLLGATLSGYADYLGQQGEIDRSASLAMQSFRFFLERGNRFERADALGPLARLALLRGDLAQAHTLLQEAVAIAGAVNSKSMVRNWQPLLGLVTLYRGDVATAHRLLNESLQLCLELKNKFFLARVCIYLAERALWQAGIDEAAHWLQQSLGYQAKSPRITIDDVQCLWVAARLATAKGQYTLAATLFGLAEQIHGQIHYCIGGPLRALADAALATVQAALEPAVFADAFAAGQGMTVTVAFTTILTP